MQYKNYLHYYIEKHQNIMVIFIVSIVFISLERKRNLNLTKKLCKNKNSCEIEMSSEKDKILEFKQYMKSDKMPCIIYADVN